MSLCGKAEFNLVCSSAKEQVFTEVLVNEFFLQVLDLCIMKSGYNFSYVQYFKK